MFEHLFIPVSEDKDAYLLLRLLLSIVIREAQPDQLCKMRKKASKLQRSKRIYVHISTALYVETFKTDIHAHPVRHLIKHFSKVSGYKRNT